MAIIRRSNSNFYLSPIESIKITTKEGDITASPFKKGKDNNEPVNIEDIKKIYH